MEKKNQWNPPLGNKSKQKVTRLFFWRRDKLENFQLLTFQKFERLLVKFFEKTRGLVSLSIDLLLVTHNL